MLPSDRGVGDQSEERVGGRQNTNGEIANEAGREGARRIHKTSEASPPRNLLGP